MGDALTVIRPATLEDAGAIAAIYAHYVRDSVITFEVDVPTVEEMAGRMAALMPAYPYLVAERDGAVVGYAYAAKLYERAAYRWATEATVYVATGHHRQGIGRALYRDLIERLKAQGFQAVLGKITLPNPASTELHEAFGFALCGVLPRVGYKHGAWYDVGIYQLELGDRPVVPAETLPA
jgi:L-amino acid N-acyltransferase YncA